MEYKKGVLILTFCFSPNVGGVETHLQDLISYFKKNQKFKIYVLTYQPITTKAKGKYFEREGNIVIIRLPWFGFNLFHKLESYPVLEFLYITPWLLLWTTMLLLFRRKSIDVIHAQGFNAAFVARLQKKLFNKRVIVSTHAVYEMNPDSLMAKMVKWTLMDADKILALSEASRKELIKIGLNPLKINTFTYWLDQDVFKPMDKIEAKTITGLQSKFIVLFVGRFIKVKGIDLLLDVAKKINENIYFVFVGDGPLSETIRDASKVHSNIVYIGRIENNELPVYYNSADLLCVPSQYEEGFGRVILESLSCGTPVLASNKGGIPEAVNETVGMLIEPSVVNVQEKIELLYKKPGMLQKMASQCREYALKHFSRENAGLIIENYNSQK